MSAAAVEAANRLVDSGEPPCGAPAEVSTRMLAWALKDVCYAAWSSEPQRAAKAADALRALCGAEHTRAEPGEHAHEVRALADWTEGIAHLTRGQMAEATDRLDGAAQTFRALGQADHAAQTQVPKIMALSMLGRYDAAVECAERAQREFVALGDVQGAGKVSLNLGALHERRGDFARAARHSREAAVLFARVGDHERSVSADINMGNALTSLGDFDEALRIYARARMRAGHHGFPVLLALVDESVALLQLARGRFRDALAGFESSRLQYEQLAMPQQLAIAEKQLADAYLELRLLPEALAVYDRAVARFQELSIPDELAWALAQRGRALALLGRSAHAGESFQMAASLFATQGSGVGESAVALARAELALASGETVVAYATAARAAQGFAAAGLADAHCRADVVRAHALLSVGSLEQGSALFDSTLVRARELQSLTVQVRCLTGQGMAAQAMGDVPSAKAAFLAAVELFEDQRRALPGDELRSAFLTDHLRPYQELLRMAMEAHDSAPDEKLATDVLMRLDRFRARSLGERLNRQEGSEDTPATRTLRERLNWLYRRVQRMEDEGEPSVELATTLADELRRTELELLEGARRARLAARMPEHPVGADGELDVLQLQGLLGASGALVEYGVLDDELFACVVTATGVSLQRRLARWGDVLQALRAVLFQIDSLRHGAGQSYQQMDGLTHRTLRRMARLNDLVWAPLTQALAGCARVLVVPHAQLGLLPFAALHGLNDSQEAVDLHAGPGPLGLRCDLAVVASAHLAVRGLLRRPAPPCQALALGESTRLPHTAHEARLVAGLFPQSCAFVGAQASLATLQAHAGSADVIHLACHAQFRSDNPMFSALHLAEGPLTVERVESLTLQPGTVVLSACETGLAEFGSGDEMVGLVRAFLVAGAARVLASLWPVDDAVTACFMASFYGALCAGQEPSAALRVAQTEVRLQHPHPFYWAAFTLHGGW